MTNFAIKAAFATGIINAEARTLEGVSVITEGPALGHGVMIDEQTLDSVKECAEEYRGGLKVKMNHYSGADAIVGRITNFRKDGTQLRADMSLLRSHPMSAVVMEMAETMPDAFGLSISFSGQVEEKEDGEKYARCLEIYSCDIVDQPAANPNGLFSRIDTTNKQTPSPMIIETPEYLDLQAKHGELTKAHALAEAQIATLKNDLECAAQANKDLVAKAAEVSTKLSEKDAEIETLKAAQADFDAKVELAAQAKMAALGAPPAAINPSANADADAALYERFKAADSQESQRLLNDPETGPRIRRESAKRHA